MVTLKKRYLLCLMFLWLFADCAVSTVFTDANSANSLWQTAENWDSGVPTGTTGEIAYIYGSGGSNVNCDIDANTSASIYHLLIGATSRGPGSVTMTGGTLTGTGISTVGISISYTDDGTFTLSDGTVDLAGMTRIGRASGKTGTLNISGGTFSTETIRVGYTSGAYADVVISETGLLEVKSDSSTGLYFTPGSYGEIEINDSAQLTWAGDHADALNALAREGTIYTNDSGAWLLAAYDDEEDITTMSVATGTPTFDNDANENDLWETPGNWVNYGPPVGTLGEMAYVAKSGGVDCNIDDSTTAYCYNLLIGKSTLGEGTVSMHGGLLTSTSKVGTTSGLVVGYQTAGYLYLNDGEVNVPGMTRISRLTTTNATKGILYVIGGTYTTGTMRVGYDTGSYGVAAIQGDGVLEIKYSSSTGLTFPSGNGYMAIKENGQLKWAGNRVSSINTLISDNYIRATGTGEWLDMPYYDSGNGVTILEANGPPLFTDAGVDHLWQTAGNWDPCIPVSASQAFIAKTGGVECIINSATSASVYNLFLGRSIDGADTLGPGSVSMTGGSLSVGAYLTIGYQVGGTFSMSDGTVTVGSQTRVGRTSTGESNAGHLEISGGTFTTSRLYVGYGAGTYGFVEISGGTVAVTDSGTSGIYFDPTGYSEIEISGTGTLTWAGDHASVLNGYVNSGSIYTTEPLGQWPVATYEDVNNITTLVVTDTPTYFEVESILESSLSTTIDTDNNKYEICTAWEYDSGNSLVIYPGEDLISSDVPELIVRGLDPNKIYNVKAWLTNVLSDSIGEEYNWKLSYSYDSAADALDANAPFIGYEFLCNHNKAAFYLNTINRYSMGTATPDANGQLHIYLGEIAIGESLSTEYIGWDSFEMTPVDSNATEPFPADGAEYIDEDVELSWQSGYQAVSHDVYFGTNYNNVATADRGDSEYKGQVSTPSYAVSDLSDGTYYWRIDSVDDYNSVIQTGNVWEFTTGRYIVTPEQYGADGNGVTDDTDAFYAAADAIETAGGGILTLTIGKTYRVGRQTHENGVYPYYQYANSISITNAHIRKVVIDGNNATIKLNDALYYGAFDPNTGEAIYPETEDEWTKIYATTGSLIDIERCSNVEIRNVNLDGNIESLILGGTWPSDDYGFSSPAHGLNLISNGNTVVTDVNVCDNAMDGICINAPECKGRDDDDPNQPVYMENITSHHNGRQGLSWVGGFGVTVVDCKFNHTGRNRIWNAPASGMDIEANSKTRRGKFTGCDFVNNHGFAVVSGRGPDNGNVYFENCLMLGTTAHTLGVEEPNFDFVDCNIYGQIYSNCGSNDANEATQFINCHIEDANNVLYESEYYSTTFDMSGSGLIWMGQVSKENVTFDGCTIIGNNVKPLYITDATELMIIENCDIYHNYNYPGNTFLSVLRGVYLKDVHFFENLSSTYRYYIKADGNVVVDSNVVVDGTECGWDNYPEYGGQTGTITEGTY